MFFDVVAAALWGSPVGAHGGGGGGGATVSLGRQFAGRRRHLTCGVYLTR